MNYLNLHILFSLAAANPNRDDSGSPKTLGYGGVTRSRIASQSMTRAKRRTFEADYLADATYRSVFIAKYISDVAEKLISDAGATVNAEQVELLRATAGKTISSLTAKADDGNGNRRATKKTSRRAAEAEADADTADDNSDADSGTGNEKKPTLIWLAEKEATIAARKMASDFIAGNGLALDPEDFLTPNRTDSLTIAAFGRMFAQRPDLNIEAAIQRSHAFTTHATVNEVDYFTAVDDLRAVGAGHLSIGELTSGIYYWHANLDIRQLSKTWAGINARDAHSRLTALFEALFLALPTGKQYTTAHHTVPAVVLAVPARLPASLQAAFEAPTQPKKSGEGLLAPSITKLFDEHARTIAALPSRFGTGRYAGTANIADNTTHDVPRADSLEQLAAWCAEHVSATIGQAQ